MNNLTLIGFVGGNAEVIDLKRADETTVTTFSVATKEVRGSGETRKEYVTWHKVTVFGGLQFASTIEKGDLVAVSGPIYTQSFASKNGSVQTFSLRANDLQMLKRKNVRTAEAPAAVAAATPRSFDPDAPDAFPVNPLINSGRHEEEEVRLDAVIPYDGPNGQYQTMSPTPKALEILQAQAEAQAAPKVKKTRKRKSSKPVAAAETAVAETEVVPA